MKVSVMRYCMLVYSLVTSSLPHHESHINDMIPKINRTKSQRYSKLLSISYEEKSTDRADSEIQPRIYSSPSFRQPKLCDSCNSAPWIPVVKFSQRAPKNIIYYPQDYDQQILKDLPLNTYLEPPKPYGNQESMFKKNLNFESTNDRTPPKKTSCDLNKKLQDSIGSGSESFDAVGNLDSKRNFFQYFSFVKHPYNAVKQNLTQNNYKNHLKTFDHTPSMNYARTYPKQMHGVSKNYPFNPLKSIYETQTTKSYDFNEMTNAVIQGNYQQAMPTTYENIIYQSPAPYKLVPPMNNNVKEINLPANSYLDNTIDQDNPYLLQNNGYKNYIPEISNTYKNEIVSEYLIPPKFIPPENHKFEKFNLPTFSFYNAENSVGKIKDFTLNTEVTPLYELERDEQPENSPLAKNKINNLSSIEWQCFLMNFIQYLKKSRDKVQVRMSHRCDPIELQNFITAEQHKNDYQNGSENKSHIRTRSSKKTQQEELVKFSPNLSKSKYSYHDNNAENYLHLAKKTNDQFSIQPSVGNSNENHQYETGKKRPSITADEFHISSINNLYENDASGDHFNEVGHNTLLSDQKENYLTNDLNNANRSNEGNDFLKMTEHTTVVNHIATNIEFVNDNMYHGKTNDDSKKNVNSNVLNENHQYFTEIPIISEQKKHRNKENNLTDNLNMVNTPNEENVYLEMKEHTTRANNIATNIELGKGDVFLGKTEDSSNKIENSNILSGDSKYFTAKPITSEGTTSSSTNHSENVSEIQNYLMSRRPNNDFIHPHAMFYPKGFSHLKIDETNFITETPILLTAPKKIKIVIPYRKKSHYEFKKENMDDDFQNSIDTWTADEYSNHKLSSYNNLNHTTSTFNLLQKSKSIPLFYLPLNISEANISEGSEQSNISGNVSKTWEDLTVAISPYTKERVYVVTPKSN